MAESDKVAELDYKVIASGSKGNAVRIGPIMIDCGIPFKRMKEELYKCSTLLLTHIHSDHIKPSTLHSIRKEFPRIRVYGNWKVEQKYGVDVIVSTEPFKLKRGSVIITPCEGRHDTPVTYWHIDMDGIKILYATDTNTVSNPTDDKLDYIFLESNYDERKIREIGKQYKKGRYDPLDNALRHFSTQQCKAFYYLNRRSKDSPLIELHKSERFY